VELENQQGENKMGGIIQFIMNLFFGGKKKEEIKKLDTAIKSKNEEVKDLEKKVEKLESKKRVNKKEVASLKRKVTTTKKQILKAEEAVKTDDVDEAVKFLKKFSK
jgi:peptidoglycan hydrolase CwlO-like protein